MELNYVTTRKQVHLIDSIGRSLSLSLFKGSRMASFWFSSLVLNSDYWDSETHNQSMSTCSKRHVSNTLSLVLKLLISHIVNQSLYAG